MALHPDTHESVPPTDPSIPGVTSAEDAPVSPAIDLAVTLSALDTSGHRVATVAGLCLDVPPSGEPTVYDLDLGAFLKFARPRTIRDIIARQERMGLLGEVSWRRTVRRQLVNGGGSREYTDNGAHLTEQQALLVVAKSETPTAQVMLRHIVDVFMAVRRGLVPVASVGGDPRVTELERDVRDLRRATRDLPGLTRAVRQFLGYLASYNGPAAAPTPAPVEAPAVEPTPAPEEEDKRKLMAMVREQSPTWRPRIEAFLAEMTETVDLTGPDLARGLSSNGLFAGFEDYASKHRWEPVHRYVFNVLVKILVPVRSEGPGKIMVLSVAWKPTPEQSATVTGKQRLSLEAAADKVWQVIEAKNWQRVTVNDLFNATRTARPSARARLLLDILCTRGLMRRNGSAYIRVVKVTLPKVSDLPPIPGGHGVPAVLPEVMVAVQAWLDAESRPPTRWEMGQPLAHRGTPGNLLHEAYLRWASEHDLPPWNRHYFGCAMIALRIERRGQQRATGRTAYMVWLRDGVMQKVVSQ